MFRADDQDSNAYARYPTQLTQKVTTFDFANWAVPQLVAQSVTQYVGARLSKLIVTSNDTFDNNLILYLNDGSNLTPLPFAFVPIPALSGSGEDLAKLSINCLRTIQMEPIVDIDNNGNSFLMLDSNYSLWAKLAFEITTTKKIQVVSSIDDY